VVALVRGTRRSDIHRSDIHRSDIHRSDVAVTAVLTALGTLLMVADVLGDDPGTRVDSHAWPLLPVFLLAVVPVLWWRRSLVAVLAVAIGAMAAHDLLFGHLVRCGAGLPLVFVLAFLAGLGQDRRRGLIAVGLTAVLTALVLVYDTAAGPELLPVAVVVLLVLWGIGQVARSHVAMGEELRRRNAELQDLHGRRTALEVAEDRQRLSLQLEQLLDVRLTQLETTARQGAGSDDPQRTRQALADVEESGRRTLAEMRRIVGALRGGEAGSSPSDVSLAPTPSVAQLEALLVRLGRGTLTVDGDPRLLPASLELSAYRIVEHLAAVLAEVPDAPVAVQLRFRPDALELHVSGQVARGADVRGALARTRERARLHAGSVDAKLTRGRARVVARLPVAAG
jgi:signal transduction histidine kinase